ncbi:YfjP family GTPase [Nonomuraea gerenzanensis]|uniref:Putative ABC iron siderophore transporter, fused permease and ATPase domains n=1 Tax=Nonomuraea gerenzanensis TaxID=93944 RepID=A0A1M4ER55_9ACTN|nr:YfjP family GTPase [Nonomuraea gerenzanensis]UBU12776.1 YfjP family GTPase [Nonomuraea gerenzanensis]SBP01332.1 Putative ABC iron siderophore transporter, fused permease and ATPase domains [Nonomuraea gerenzanensis]
MKLLRRKEGPSLDTRLAALLEAATLGEGRLSEQAVSGARAVAERAGVRRDLSIDHTVAALAGATGSGKSSLYNALAGEDLADVGVTRPTTSTAQAALWDGAGAGPLLDWLDVPRRHSATDPGLTGLVLLDLPDHDSIRLSHRLEVDRLVEQVDLLVWVVDPQKYADAALHERYLRPLAAHQDVMVVVLNQVDRLPADAVNRCLRDLRRLLDDDGLPGIAVLAVSARTGKGLDELRALLGDRVTRRRSWSARLAADIGTAADHLATAGPAQAVDGPAQALEADGPARALEADGPARALEADGPGRASEAGAAGSVPGNGALALGRAGAGGEELVGGNGVLGRDGAAKRMAGAERALTGALCAAAGVPMVVEAVAKGHRHRAVVATGWPVTRWMRRFRPDPLRRLRLGGMAPRGRSGGGSAGVLASGRPTGGGYTGGEIVGRTSVPAASAVQRAQVETAVRDVGEVAASGLPGPWAVSVRQVARSHARELADAVDRAVATTSAVGTKRPRWWRAVNALQWLVFATMLAGALWLGVLFGMDYLRLPQPPLPTAGVVPWPTVLLVGGALAGVLIALLSRLAAWAGGRRRARRTAKALRASIGQVGGELVLQPVEAELDTYARFTEALELARART